jgi:hypothetical protein
MSISLLKNKINKKWRIACLGAVSQANALLALIAKREP